MNDNQDFYFDKIAASIKTYIQEFETTCESDEVYCTLYEFTTFLFDNWHSKFILQAAKFINEAVKEGGDETLDALNLQIFQMIYPEVAKKEELRKCLGSDAKKVFDFFYYSWCQMTKLSNQQNLGDTFFETIPVKISDCIESVKLPPDTDSSTALRLLAGYLDRHFNDQGILKKVNFLINDAVDNGFSITWNVLDKNLFNYFYSEKNKVAIIRHGLSDNAKIVLDFFYYRWLKQQSNL